MNQQLINNTLKNITQKLLSEDNIYYFFKPINPNNDDVPDYYQKITNPMYFYKIQEKIDNNEYKNLEDYISDVRLIWFNAKIYHQPNNPIYRAADRLSKRFEFLISSLPKRLNSSEKKTSLQRYIELRFSIYQNNKEIHQ